jgi:hypothetical protein
MTSNPRGTCTLTPLPPELIHRRSGADSLSVTGAFVRKPQLALGGAQVFITCAAEPFNIRGCNGTIGYIFCGKRLLPARSILKCRLPHQNLFNPIPMALSSNTLIHFTSNKDFLKGILTENFKVKYCCEKINLVSLKPTLHIPMVSFCDIPLSQIKDHIASYGHYGIGLSREWAVKNRLNPVLYVQSGSSLAEAYEVLLKQLTAEEKKGAVDKDPRRMAKDIVRYIKNYEGPLERTGMATVKNYRYSDEREWRYVPQHDECPMLYTEKDFKIEGKEAANAKASSLRLEFGPDDIKYIIIRNDDEIREFVTHLREAKGDKYSLGQIERLTTRLLTTEQIHGDI